MFFILKIQEIFFFTFYSEKQVFENRIKLSPNITLVILTLGFVIYILGQNLVIDL